MKKLLHIIPILFLFPLSIWADGSCSIEQSPPSELTNYLNQVSAKLSKISTTASKKNNCDTLFKSEKKAFNGTLTSVNGLLDEVDLEMNLRNGISIDFLYNIKTSFDGTAREPVIHQGQVIHDIEDRITSTVKMVAASCNLDTPVAGIDGRKAGVILKEVISQNRKLEYYFKSVATGDLTPPDGVAPTDGLYTAIASNYSPSATANCKNQYGFEEVMAKLQGGLDTIGKGITAGLESWKKAIRMFRGEEGTIAEQQALAQKLLAQELSRQGLSQSAQSIMLGNLSCFQRSTNKDSTIEELAKAREDCGKQSTQGMLGSVEKSFVDAFTKDYAKKPQTMNTFLKNTLKVDTAKSNIKDIGTLWNEINSTISSTDETTVNEQVLSDLVSMHMQLVSINALLKQKIPDMQKNCMKENPNIVGACR